MRSPSFLITTLLLFLAVDIYIYFAIRTSLFGFSSQKSKVIFTLCYWLLTLLSVGGLFLFRAMQQQEPHHLTLNILFSISFAIILAKVLVALFFLIDDVRRLIQWIFGKFFSAYNEMGEVSGADAGGISRSSFLTWLGIAAGGSFLSTFIYGMSNKYNYKIKRVPLQFSNLPPSFRGLKIVQISDIHSGSFNNKRAVNRGIDLILNEKPDVIFFTGDLVNNRAIEMEDYIDSFARLKAPMGVYSTLGNHDYGDYGTWESAEAKTGNLQRLKQIHAEMGWRLLLDENLPLTIAKESIGLIGVQNISGKSNFHSYGNMKKAMQGADKYPFKILLSHDPSHWDSEVNTIYTDVDLMLSGHTHGMQFGVEIPGFRWSPVQYVYKQWAGLYEKGKQKLYVNRGYGFIGYPGRVGILPEITVFTLE